MGQLGRQFVVWVFAVDGRIRSGFRVHVFSFVIVACRLLAFFLCVFHCCRDVAVLASSVEGNVSGKKFEGRQHASRQNEVFLGAKNHLLAEIISTVSHATTPTGFLHDECDALILCLFLALLSSNGY